MKITVNLNEITQKFNLTLSDEKREYISQYIKRKDLSGKVDSETFKSIEKIAFLAKNKEQVDIVLKKGADNNFYLEQGKDNILAAIYNNSSVIDLIVDISESEIAQNFASFKIIDSDYIVKKDKFLIDWSQIIQNVELKKQKLLEDITKGKVSNNEVKNIKPELYTYDIFLASVKAIKGYGAYEVNNINLKKEFLENIEKDLDIVIEQWNYFQYIFKRGKILELIKKMTLSEASFSDFIYDKGIRDYIVDQSSIKSSSNILISNFLAVYIERQNQSLKKYQEELLEYEKVKQDSSKIVSNYTVNNYSMGLEYKISNCQKNILIVKKNIKDWTELYNKSQSNKIKEPIVEFELVELLNKYFSDMSYIKEQASNKFVSFFHSHFPEDIRSDKDVIKKALNVPDPGYSLLEKIDLSDMSFVIDLWETNSSYCAKNSNFIKRLNKKKDFIFFVNNIKNTSHLLNIFNQRDLPKKIQEDEKILNLLFDKSPNSNFVQCISTIPESIIDRLINENKINFIPDNELYNKTDKDIMKKIVLSKPNIMLNSSLPESWTKNKELVYLLPENVLENFTKDGSFWEEFTQGDIKEYEKLIHLSYKKYFDFNDDIKTNMSFFSYVIQKDTSIPRNIDSYPNEIFLNKEVLLKLLPKNVAFIQKIYPIMWQDKEFIVSYGKLLDEIAVDSYDIKRSDYMKALPYDIRNLIEIEGIEKEFEKFFLNCSLFEVMEEKQKPTKRNKI